MAYTDNQTLNFLTQLEDILLMQSEFAEQWAVLYDEWQRNGISGSVTQELLDASKYAGMAPTTVTTAVSAGESMHATLTAAGDFLAWLQQIQMYCKNL